MYKDRFNVLADFIDDLNNRGQLSPIVKAAYGDCFDESNPKNSLKFEKLNADCLGGIINPKYTNNNYLYNKIFGDIILSLPGDGYCFCIDVKISRDNNLYYASIDSNSLKNFKGYYLLYVTDRSSMILIDANELYDIVLKRHEEWLYCGLSGYNLNIILKNNRIKFRKYIIKR